MFKEKYLIFEEGESQPGLSENPDKGQDKGPDKEPNEGPKEREAHSQDTAEDLSNEKSVEEKVEEVLRQLYELFANRDVPIFEKFAHISRKIVTMAEIFFGDKTKTLLTERIKAGYEFGGYGYSGAMLYWWKPEESSTSIEVNPLFLEPEIFCLLSPKMKELVKKCQLEVLQNEINIEFVKIFNVLLENNVISKTFDLQRFRNSDFGNDVFEVVEAGKNVPGGQGYKWSVTKKGVSFMASDFLKTKKWEDVHLKLEDYDQNLNYKALSPRPPEVVMSFPEPPVEQETSDEKPPEGSSPYRPTDEELRVHKEKMKGYKQRMKEIVNDPKAQGLVEFNKKLEEFIGKDEELISAAANEGILSGDAFLRVIVPLHPPNLEIPEDKQDDPLYNEYYDVFIKAIKAPWDLYYPNNN